MWYYKYNLLKWKLFLKHFLQMKYFYGLLFPLKHIYIRITNHVEFSLILTHGTYKNSLFFKQNERNFILIFYILSRRYNSFQENCKKLHFVYWVFFIFGQKCHFSGDFLLSSFGWCIHKITFWEHILLRKLNILHAN